MSGKPPQCCPASWIPGREKMRCTCAASRSAWRRPGLGSREAHHRPWLGTCAQPRRLCGRTPGGSASVRGVQPEHPGLFRGRGPRFSRASRRPPGSPRRSAASGSSPHVEARLALRPDCGRRSAPAHAGALRVLPDPWRSREPRRSPSPRAKLGSRSPDPDRPAADPRSWWKVSLGAAKTPPRD